MQLMELQPGKKAVIRRLDGGRPVMARLAAMGFTPGAAITVIRSSDHGPLLVSLRGSRVALGQGEAAHIFVSFAGKEKPAETEPTAPGTITIALTGQPNVGKSSVFNLMTGMNQHVGNWTGKTIECKVGTFKFKGIGFSIVDLPGTYSLTASSEEERLARDFIIQESPHCRAGITHRGQRDGRGWELNTPDTLAQHDFVFDAANEGRAAVIRVWALNTPMKLPGVNWSPNWVLRDVLVARSGGVNGMNQDFQAPSRIVTKRDGRIVVGAGVAMDACAGGRRPETIEGNHIVPVAAAHALGIGD